jgi:hypothetical protein
VCVCISCLVQNTSTICIHVHNPLDGYSGNSHSPLRGKAARHRIVSHRVRRSVINITFAPFPFLVLHSLAWSACQLNMTALFMQEKHRE